MQAMWVSLRKNVSCRGKLNDVVNRQQKCSKKRSYTYGKENLNYTMQLHEMRNPAPVREMLFRPNYPRTEFCHINTGDPSRNIIETIFQKASLDPSRPSRRIKSVLKVKNSVETLERFENYREKVKKNHSVQYTGHPRSTVDGNELLLFYGTVMTCGERLTQVSDLCKDPFCRVCKIIQSNFDTHHMKKNGIQLSRCSEELCENMIALTKVKKIQRAVIVCRTIAGRVGNPTVDGAYEGCDSFRSRGLHSNLEVLIVTNPCAVLPCFVVIFT